jgi:hypothetical protein
VEPELLAQFPLLKETLCALVVVVWAMGSTRKDRSQFAKTRQISVVMTIDRSCAQALADTGRLLP